MKLEGLFGFRTDLEGEFVEDSLVRDVICSRQYSRLKLAGEANRIHGSTEAAVHKYSTIVYNCSHSSITVFIIAKISI